MFQSYFLKKAATKAFDPEKPQEFKTLVARAAALELQSIANKAISAQKNGSLTELSKVIQLKSRCTWLPWKSGENFDFFNPSYSIRSARKFGAISDTKILETEMESLVERCKQAGVSLTFEQENSYLGLMNGMFLGQNSRLKATFKPIEP